MWFCISRLSQRPRPVTVGRSPKPVMFRERQYVDHVYVGPKGSMSVAERLTALVERHPDRYVRITASRPAPSGRPASYATASAMLRR